MEGITSWRVAVITPYHREPIEQIRQCHESVRSQTVPCDHFLVADGHPQPDVATWPAQHFILPRAHGDFGNTARGLGALAARNEGYDAVAFLDADNWYAPGHIASMIEVHQITGAPVCTSGRTLHRPDGSFLAIDRHDSDGKTHVDTSCFFLTREAFGLLPIWALMPPNLHQGSDRVFWQAIVARDIRRAHRARPTVAYRTIYRSHYEGLGQPVPPNAKPNVEAALEDLLHWAGPTPGRIPA